MSTASTAPRLFGTDGIRSRFGEAPLDRPTVTALGYHLGRKLTEEADAAQPAGEVAAETTVILGGDTRDSTPSLVRWMTAGLTAAGVPAVDVGVLPTPGVAFLVRATGAAAGVAVSASHNRHPDNGIKLIAADGFKWTPEAEAGLETRLGDDASSPATGDARPGPPPKAPGDAGELVHRYLEALAATVRADPRDRPLTGLSVVLDPAHGAASPFAEPLFAGLGAEVTVLHAEPDGTNINRHSGSTHPRAVAEEVRRRGAHLGVAFDGDADRAILADERGEVRDGDAELYLWAKDLHASGELRPPAVVATSMSNLGLARALQREGIELVRCDVGDRRVVETLRRRGLRLGGEQSGHIVHLDLATTGDGLLTALQMAVRVARAPERSLGGLLKGFRRYPQVLVNVRVADKPPLEDLPAVRRAVKKVEEQLGDDGRLVLRYSGTEPLARVMIEGREQGEIEALARGLAEAIRSEIGARSPDAPVAGDP